MKRYICRLIMQFQFKKFLLFNLVDEIDCGFKFKVCKTSIDIFCDCKNFFFLLDLNNLRNRQKKNYEDEELQQVFLGLHQPTY